MKNEKSVERPVTSESLDSTNQQMTTADTEATTIRETLRQMLDVWSKLTGAQIAIALQIAADRARALVSDVERDNATTRRYGWPDDVVCAQCGKLVARQLATCHYEHSVRTIREYLCAACVDSERAYARKHVLETFDDDAYLAGVRDERRALRQLAEQYPACSVDQLRAMLATPVPDASDERCAHVETHRISDSQGATRRCTLDVEHTGAHRFGGWVLS